MTPLRDYIRHYLDGEGAVVDGAGVASHFPEQMGPPTDVTKLMRESFEEQGPDAERTTTA